MRKRHTFPPRRNPIKNNERSAVILARNLALNEAGFGEPDRFAMRVDPDHVACPGNGPARDASSYGALFPAEAGSLGILDPGQNGADDEGVFRIKPFEKGVAAAFTIQDAADGSDEVAPAMLLHLV